MQETQEEEVRLEDLPLDQQVEFLKEKNQKLIDLLEEALSESPKKVATVKAGPDERGFYRVHVSGSEDVIVMANPSITTHVPVESEIIFCAGIIEEVLSEDLKPEIEELEFDRIQWEDIKGLKSQVSIIQNTIEGPLNNPEIYEEFRLPPLKGLALYGPPGVGCINSI